MKSLPEWQQQKNQELRMSIGGLSQSDRSSSASLGGETNRRPIRRINRDPKLPRGALLYSSRLANKKTEGKRLGGW